MTVAGIASAGVRVPGVVGSEYDRVNPGVPTPAGIEVLTHSPLTCRNTLSYSDSAYYMVPQRCWRLRRSHEPVDGRAGRPRPAERHHPAEVRNDPNCHCSATSGDG
jgi:hypothetical protein